MSQFVFFDSIGTGVRLTVANFDDLILAQGVTVGSTDNTAIRVTGGGSDIMILGSVYGVGTAISLGTQAGSGNNLVIGESAVVAAESYGVSVYNNGSHLTNFGQILAYGVGVIVATNAGSAVHILNAGSIFGDDIGIFASFAPQIILNNTGTITTVGGQSYTASAGSTCIDIIHNRGTMTGDVNLTAGNDLYDGRGGSIEGVVYGGNDDDTFIAGVSEEVFDGGDGIDLLDFTKSA
ncbi:MAG: hypothetical protein ABI832_24555, partial [bacterium]